MNFISRGDRMYALSPFLTSHYTFDKNNSINDVSTCILRNCLRMLFRLSSTASNGHIFQLLLVQRACFYSRNSSAYIRASFMIENGFRKLEQLLLQLKIFVSVFPLCIGNKLKKDFRFSNAIVKLK